MADVDDTNVASEDEAPVDESQAQDEQVEDKAATSSESDEQVENQDDRYSIEDWNPDEKRFTQFKGDNPKEYFSKLEDAYAASYNEYKKVKDQLETLKAEKLTATATPAVDDKKQTTPVQQSVTDMWVDKEMKRIHAEQYGQFAAKHPEVNTDDDLFTRLDQETGKYMNYVLNTEKRVADLDESLNWAWNIINPEDGKSSREEKVVTAVKNAGAGEKSKGVTKDAAKPLFTDQQIAAAQKLNPTLRDKTRSEIEEIMSKYVK